MKQNIQQIDICLNCNNLYNSTNLYNYSEVNSDSLTVLDKVMKRETNGSYTPVCPSCNNATNLVPYNFKNYIISQIDTEYYNFKAKETKDKIEFVLECFDKEFNFLNNKKRYPSLVTRFSEWIQGLPGIFEVPFYYDQILQVGLKFGLINPGRTEDKEDIFLNNWFELCAKTFLDAARDHGININNLK